MLIHPLTEGENHSRTVNNSSAEFLLLKKLENISKKRGWIIYRSLRLENHATKIEGEIDIVIFTQTLGIILLEVKGSNLQVQDGQWSTFNRGARKWVDIQNPFDQMRDGYFAFKNETKELFRLFNIKPMISWGCVFPECDHIKGTISYPSWRFCDAVELDDLEIFLAQLVKKERNKLSNLQRRNTHPTLEPKISYSILEKLAPTREKGNLVSPEYNETLIALEKETEMVHNLMNAFSFNNFIFAEGAAGTGKTRAAIYECDRLSRSGKTFLFLCRSEFLAEHLKKWLAAELMKGRSQVLWGTGLPEDINPSNYDALLIDEAQDLVHLENIRELILNFSQRDALIRLFGDFDFQNLYRSKVDIISWFKGNRLHPSFSRLSTNCRNTMQIGTKIRRLAAFDDSIFSLSAIQGESLQIHCNIHDEELPAVVQQCITEWTNKDYPASAITLLTYKGAYPLVNEQEFFKKVDVCSYENKDLEENSDMVSHTSAMNFKGLESPCIILLVNIVDEDWEKILYTAISRARLKCYLIFSDKIPPIDLQKILCKI